MREFMVSILITLMGVNIFMLTWGLQYDLGIDILRWTYCVNVAYIVSATMTLMLTFSEEKKRCLVK